MYEYTTRVFSVGLEGFASVDTDVIAALTAEGWEPTLMTPVHNGFATIVLFRREGGAAGWVAPPAKARASAAAAAAAAAAGRSGKAVGSKSPAKAAPAARVRRARPAR